MSGLLNKIFQGNSKSGKKSTASIKVEKDLPAETPVEPILTDRPVKKAKREFHADGAAYRILEQPVITEKSTDLAAMNKYVFMVPVSATKSEVLKKVHNVFGVKPIKINIMMKAGSKVRYGRKFGRQKNWKKAIVTLAAKDKIEIFEGV
jgi:large subunit ribosomal protein L23